MICFNFLNLEQGGAKISRPEYPDPNPLILVGLQKVSYVVQIKIFKLTLYYIRKYKKNIDGKNDLFQISEFRKRVGLRYPDQTIVTPTR